MRKQRNYWTKELCQVEALKYNNRHEFKINSKSCYCASCRYGWLEDITKNMVGNYKQRGHWTFEKCKEVASEYDTKISFYNDYKGVYTKCYKNGWLDEICSHMKNYGDKYKRCIYSYEFSDNFVYVGLTCNLIKRQQRRNSNQSDQVTKHTNETGLIPIRKQLTDYIDVNKSIKLEEFYVKLYKIKKWNILNKIRTGGIGRINTHWTFDSCLIESLKYKTKSEFKFNSSGAYSVVIKNGWMEDVCLNNLNFNNKKLKYDTKDKCLIVSLKYKTRSEFANENRYVYGISLKNNWLDDICSHMIEIKKTKNYWSKDKCLEESLKYDSRSLFCGRSRSAYNTSYRNGWLDEFYPKIK